MGDAGVPAADALNSEAPSSAECTEAGVVFFVR